MNEIYHHCRLYEMEGYALGSVLVLMKGLLQ